MYSSTNRGTAAPANPRGDSIITKAARRPKAPEYNSIFRVPEYNPYNPRMSIQTPIQSQPVFAQRPTERVNQSPWQKPPWYQDTSNDSSWRVYNTAGPGVRRPMKPDPARRVYTCKCGLKTPVSVVKQQAVYESPTETENDIPSLSTSSRLQAPGLIWDFTATSAFRYTCVVLLFCLLVVVLGAVLFKATKFLARNVFEKEFQGKLISLEIDYDNQSCVLKDAASSVQPYPGK